MVSRFANIDWFCDSYLKNQVEFDDRKYIWQCTECDHKNSISSANIYDSKEDFYNKNR